MNGPKRTRQWLRAPGRWTSNGQACALHAAAKRAILGKRRKPSASAFYANLEGELLRLERQLRDGSYRPGRYETIEVRDPKRRLVSAATS